MKFNFHSKIRDLNTFNPPDTGLNGADMWKKHLSTHLKVVFFGVIDVAACVASISASLTFH